VAQRIPWLFEDVPAWHDTGACRGLGPTLFFEEQHEIVAKSVCASCPVVAACREWAVSAGSGLYGVWGATSHRERIRIRKAQRRAGAA